MDNTNPAADKSPPTEGAAEEAAHVAAESGAAADSGAAAASVQDGEEQKRSGFTSPSVDERRETPEEEGRTIRVVSSEENTPRKADAPSLPIRKAETCVETPSRPPPLLSYYSAPSAASAGAPTWNSPPAATRETDVCATGEGGPPSANTAVDLDAFTVASSLPYSPANVQGLGSSPVPSSLFIEGSYRTGAGEAPLRKGSTGEGDVSYSTPQLREERSEPYSLSSEKGRDDIIEFVVERPTDGAAAVPYFLAADEERWLPASAPDPFHRDGAFVDIKGRAFVPEGEAERQKEYFYVPQQEMQVQHRQQERLIPEKEGMTYAPARPRVFVLLPVPEGNMIAGPDIDSFARKSVLVPVDLPGLPSPDYPVQPAPYVERSPRKISPRFIVESQSPPVDRYWKVQEESPRHLVTFQDRRLVAPVRFPVATPRRLERENEIVIPDGKRLLCFGHAGDEIKFCFGLLQLPPRPLKYDFVIKKKPIYCGMCEKVDYVAVCRKCRMRLPTCPFCHKQSAIRHP